ncbi:hypothetical protein [Streptomyces sp. NPDC001978]|uniref:hypothetical protein n=1 Tax=Streptomyces sp. NPDC001978 TaxID=3364627 RepID=UPI0036A3764F
MPAPPHPCEKLSLLFWATLSLEQLEVAQQGVTPAGFDPAAALDAVRRSSLGPVGIAGADVDLDQPSPRSTP